MGKKCSLKPYKRKNLEHDLYGETLLGREWKKRHGEDTIPLTGTANRQTIPRRNQNWESRYPTPESYLKLLSDNPKLKLKVAQQILYRALRQFPGHEELINAQDKVNRAIEIQQNFLKATGFTASLPSADPDHPEADNHAVEIENWKDREFLYASVMSYLQSGSAPKAFRDLRTIYQIDNRNQPNGQEMFDMRFLYYLALTYQEQGRYGLAWACCEKARGDNAERLAYMSEDETRHYENILKEAALLEEELNAPQLPFSFVQSDIEGRKEYIWDGSPHYSHGDEDRQVSPDQDRLERIQEQMELSGMGSYTCS